MKRNFVRAVLLPDNAKTLEKWYNSPEGQEAVRDLLTIIAEVLDDRASGEDAYITIGGTRDHSSHLLSVHLAGGTHQAGGDSLATLLIDLKRFV